jgi:putative ATP-binding cassette transporter
MRRTVTQPATLLPGNRVALRRFWQTARGFWRGRSAWVLLALLAIGVVLQLLVQYRLNLWNRDFFNALEARDAGKLWHQARILLLLAGASVTLAVTAVWGRMTVQRLWRDWLTGQLIVSWLADKQCQRVSFVNGQRQNAEYRITEDARIATDAPIDFVVSLLSSLLVVATFIVVLWNVGGVLEIRVWQSTISIPGHLVIASVIYALATTLGMTAIGRHMAEVIERKNQVEADFKFVVARANMRTMSESLVEDTSILDTAQAAVIHQWRRLCGQYMRTTVVSHGNSLLAPIIGVILCAPNYILGTVTLGEVTQAGAAFFAIQGAFNWLVDNYPRLAEWMSSAYRVGILLNTLDDTEPDRSSDEAAVPASADHNRPP